MKLVVQELMKNSEEAIDPLPKKGSKKHQQAKKPGPRSPKKG